MLSGQFWVISGVALSTNTTSHTDLVGLVASFYPERPFVVADR